MAKEDVEIQVEADTNEASKRLSEISNKLSGVTKAVKTTATAFTAAGAALFLFTNKMTQGAASIQRLSTQTGISVKNLQLLKYAAEQSGASGEAMLSTLESLTQRIGNAALYGDNAFNMFGIYTRDSTGGIKTAVEVLDQIRQRVQRIQSIPIRNNMLSQLGISPELYELMLKTDREMKEFNKQAEELGLISEENTKRSEAYQRQVKLMKMQLSNFSNKIALQLIPIVQKVVGWLSKLWDKLVGIFGENGATTIFGVGLLAMVLPIGKIFTAFKGLFGFLKAAFKWVTPAMLKIGGILATIGLAVEDLWAAFRGGDSLFGRFWKFLQSGEGVISNLNKAFEGLLFLIGGDKLMSAWQGFINKVGIALDYISGLYDKLKALLGLGDEVTTPIIGDNNHSTMPSQALGGFSNIYSPPISQPQNIVINNNINTDVHSSDPAVAGKIVLDGQEKYLKLDVSRYGK
jgi:hypothetical protein